MAAPSRLLNDPAQAWSAYDPSTDGAWDLGRVAHLHRRAGFAAPWPILRRDLEAGPVAAVDRLLEGEPNGLDGLSASEQSELMDSMAHRMAAGGVLRNIQAAWLYRMIFTAHPLRERMTLFWHNHFATSDAKVKNTVLMQRQNDLLRENALGNFAPMLRGMARDVAMLQWLDSSANRKAHPNENYAREVMELFSLGRGNYTEKDIQDAARAFTGSFVQNDRFKAMPAQHDDGEKTILGKKGKFTGDDVATILLEQPACAEFLCRKLYRHFVSEIETPTKELLEPLAKGLRESGYDIRVPVVTILKSKLFYDATSRRKRVKSPVEFTVGTIRALEIVKPTVSTDALAETTAKMGQALFAPPSVAGWEGGPAWINTTTTLGRSNFILGLLGKEDPFGGRFTPKGGADAYVDLLVQDAFDANVRAKIRGNDALTLILTSPEYQLA